MIDNKKHLGGECVDSYILCLYVLQSSQRNKSEKIQPILYLHWIKETLMFGLTFFYILLILFAMSYYVREIVNSLYYSILKKSSFFFFYMTTRDFNLCISLINLASNIQILNNCIQHVGTNRPNGTVDTFQIYTEVFLAIRNLTLKLTRPVS